MKRGLANIITLVSSVFILLAPIVLKANDGGGYLYLPLPRVGTLTALPPDTSELRYPFSLENNYPYPNSGLQSPLYGHQPSNIQNSVTYDPVTKQYSFTRKVGNFEIGPPYTMTEKEYENYSAKKSMENYWELKSKKRKHREPVLIYSPAQHRR